MGRQREKASGPSRPLGSAFLIGNHLCPSPDRMCPLIHRANPSPSPERPWLPRMNHDHGRHSTWSSTARKAALAEEKD